MEVRFNCCCLNPRIEGAAVDLGAYEFSTAPPTAEFIVDKASGPAALTVQFTDRTRGTATSWLWDFGDGATSTEQHPAHTFTSEGTYTVSLTASNSGGATTASLLISATRPTAPDPDDLEYVYIQNFAQNSLETPMVGDFNGDGITDLIAFCRNNPNSYGDVYVGLLGSYFILAAQWSDWFAVSQEETVVIGDFNGDGMDDAAAWQGAATKEVYVALSYGSGFEGAAVWLNSLGGDVLKTGDADGDGRTDLILFSRSTGKVYVALSMGGGFSSPQVWHNFFAVSTYERPEVGDLNGDGRVDIITFGTNSPTAFGDVYVALSTGDQFSDGSSSEKWHDWFSIDPSETIRIGDLDEDGMADFLTFLQAGVLN